MDFYDPYGIIEESRHIPSHKWQEWLASCTEQQLAQLQITYRENCRRSVLFLAREVLGYDWVEYDLQYHRELEKQAMCNADSLTLAPRSFIKSTIVTIAGTIWYFIQDEEGSFKEHCVLIVSNNKENAKKFLRGITEHFTSNLFFRWLFEDYCPIETKEDPTKEQYTIPSRLRKGRREASFEIAGIDTSLAGRHYEKIIEDDIVHEINVPPKGSAEVMIGVWEQHRNLDHLLKTGMDSGVVPHRTVVGTRWHDGDAYGQMLDPDNEIYNLMEVLIAEPYGNMWRNQDNRTGLSWNNGGRIRTSEQGVLWPNRYPEPYLSELRKKRGSYGWACLMAQDPLPPDSATKFDPKWFHRDSLEDYFRNPVNYSTAVIIDPAFNEDSTRISDRTAITVVAERSDGAPFLLWCKAGKLTPNQIADIALAAVLEWPNSEWLGIEATSGGRAIYNTVKQAANERGLDIWVRPLEHKGMKKNARVAMLVARAQRCGFYYGEGVKEEYIQEILRYGVGARRDIPDAIAYKIVYSDTPEEAKRKKVSNRAFEYKPKAVTGADILKRIEGKTSKWRPWVCSR